MRKVITLEIWEDETMEDSEKCVEEVIKEAMSHCYCSDGTVDIRIVENLYEAEYDEIYKMVQERKNSDSECYTLDQVEEIIKEDN